jgi:hypothetical protein
VRRTAAAIFQRLCSAATTVATEVLCALRASTVTRITNHALKLSYTSAKLPRAVLQM